MILSMTGNDKSDASDLCKACGLCCTGHLFAWGKLRSTEIESAKTLGLNVLGSGPNDRGFSQPCSLWDGECTIYTSPNYPHFCGLYKCKLLKELMDESITLPEALRVVQQVKVMIDAVDSLLPVSSQTSFRERLVAHMDEADVEFQDKARRLLIFYKDRFGVKDIVDDLEDIDR
jgi:hypothetical protein